MKTFRKNTALPAALVTICLLLLFAGGTAAAQERRVALVVGNGAYGTNPLRNPPNDARDVAASLKETGFDVRLLVDADLSAFEKGVAAFAEDLRGADTGLF
jgi:uncharacterized caspase-like protein